MSNPGVPGLLIFYKEALVTRKPIVTIATAGVMVWMTCLPPAAYAAEPASRPNIVLIMCDDMGFSDIGCYGGEVQTPNLDRLAAEGLRFTQFYNCAKCTTTRASVITGLHPRPIGTLLKSNMVTLGEALGVAGYHTALSGKWHLGREDAVHPYRRGFEEYYGLLDGCCNYFDPSRPDPDFKGGHTRFFGHNDRRITEFPKDFYTTDAFTDHAITTIRRFAADKQPFFVHVCYNAPHYPLHARPEDIARYRGKYMMGWDRMREQRLERQRRMGLAEPSWKLSGTDTRAYSWADADHEFEDLRMAVYAAMIDCMDRNIGRIIQALREVNVQDNTLVLFLSDNGGCSEDLGERDPATRRPGPVDDYVAVGPSWGWAQNTPFRRYKAWVHEGGISTPLIAWWPGRIQANTITRQVGHVIDFMPTFLELAGADYPKRYKGNDILPADGRSLIPIFAGLQRQAHPMLAWYWSGNRAIRQGDWKLVWDKNYKHWELYDLSADRCETNDLAAAFPDRVQQMSEAWTHWARDTGNLEDAEAKARVSK